MLRLDLIRTDFRFVHLSPQVWFLQVGGLRLPTDIVPVDDDGGFIVRGSAFACRLSTCRTTIGCDLI